jgi:ketosteroid isomerase-like protein
LRTRDELRAHFAGNPPEDGGPESFEQANVVVHETIDPEVVIVEFSYEITRAGRQYSVPMIFVMRVRGGEIVESRDYANHVEMARATGRLEDLARALGDTA